MRIIKDENSSATDLKEIIERDPPFCADLLKLANSAVYSYPKTISDIQEAIVCIGFDAVKELALNQKVCALFMSEESFDGYKRIDLWKHSAAVAICSKMIYRREFSERGDDIYVAGLLHDIGIIVEDQFFQEMFKLSLKRSAAEKKNLYLIEREIMKIGHPDIGRIIGEDWNFPEELSKAIGFHHEPELVEGEFEKMVTTVFLADYLCQQEKIGYSDAPYSDVGLFRNCLSKLNISQKALGVIGEELKDEIRKLEALEWFTS